MKTRDTNEGQSWLWHRKYGRIQLRLAVHRNTSHLPDRWSIQPAVVYDRKRAARSRGSVSLDSGDST